MRTPLITASLLFLSLFGFESVAAPPPPSATIRESDANMTLEARFDRQVEKAAQTSSARAILSLLPLESLSFLISPFHAHRVYLDYLQRVNDPYVQRYVHHALSRAAASIGQPSQPLPGAVTDFFVSFPYENSSSSGFAQPFAPEAFFDTSRPAEGSHFQEPWQHYQSHGHHGELLPQESVYIDDFGVIYMVTRIILSGNQKHPVEARLELSSATPVTAWLNGKAVAHQATEGPASAPLYGAEWKVTLLAGEENILILKTAALENAPSVRVFLHDANGHPIAFHTDNTRPITSRALPPPEGLKPVKASLYETFFKDPTVSAPLRAMLARHIQRKDEAEATVQDLIIRQMPSVAAMDEANLLAASSVFTTAWHKMEFARAALDHHPQSELAGYLWASSVFDAASDSNSIIRVLDMLPLIRPHLEARSDPMFSSVLRANVENASNQRLNARRLLEADAPKALNYTWAMVYLQTFDQTRERVLYDQALAQLGTIDMASPVYLIARSDALIHKARSSQNPVDLYEALVTVRASVKAFFERDPYNEILWSYWLDLVDNYAPDVLAQRGQDVRACAQAGWTVLSDDEYAAWLSLRPNDPARWKRYAAFSASVGDQENSMTAYRLAASLRPQDEMLRARSTYHTDTSAAENRFERPYIVKDVPPNRDKDAVGIVSLLDQRVTRILPNGLKSTFNQLVYEVIDESGVRMLRAVPLNYSPTDERLEIISVTTTSRDGTVKRFFKQSEYDVADPSVQMYYDQKQLVIELPDLRVGDRVEYQFRRTETHRESSAMPFFGDNLQLQTTFNRQWTRYIVLSPPDFPIYFYRHVPGGAGAPAEVRQQTQGNEVVSIFEEKDVPRILGESSTPGLTELVPFLFVSSFHTWQQVADWFIDIAKPQWTADDMIRSEVARLTSGIQDRREIVRRIYSYVLHETRYVALEFGIHGHKPYPVPQIFQRKFGDCKDKASLLKVMLETAGIPTDFVLIRTRQNGDIDSKQPSLYMFDHAIIYVPEFDLFLDGTAEFNGSTELPVMDQDAFVFIVDSNARYRLSRTPLSSSADNTTTTRTTFTVSEAGVQFGSTTSFHGYNAPLYRSRYAKQKGQSEGENTRIQLERLKSQVAYTYPGSEILSADFGAIDDLEKDVVLQYEARTSYADMVTQEGTQKRLYPLMKRIDLLRQNTSGGTRTFPLMLPVPRQFDETAIVHLPAGQTVDLPAPAHIDSPFGKLDLTFEKTADGFVTHAVVELRKHRIAPDEYKAWQDFLQRLDSLLNAPIILH